MRKAKNGGPHTRGGGGGTKSQNGGTACWGDLFTGFQARGKMDEENRGKGRWGGKKKGATDGNYKRKRVGQIIPEKNNRRHQKTKKKKKIKKTQHRQVREMITRGFVGK